MKDFWFISLVALFTIAVSIGWPLGLKVAVIANAVVVLIEVVQEGRRILHGRKV